MNQDSLKQLRPMILAFIFLNIFFITGRAWLQKKGVDVDVLIIGNLLLFAASLLSYIITKKSLADANPNVFVRAMYGSFIVKFFVLAITAFVYISLTNKNVNKPGLLGCMALYILYAFFEVSSLVKLLKKKKNG